MPLVDMLGKINWSLFLSTLTGVLAIFAGIVAWSEKNKDDKKTIEFQRQTIELQQKINDITNKNLEKAEELSKQYKKNAQMQEELNNYVTGGNTKPTILINCFKRPFELIGDSYSINVDLENKGKYPLQNVICTVNDVSCAATQKHVREIRTLGGWVGRRPPLKPEEQEEVEFNTNIGSVAPNSRFPIFTGVYNFQYSKIPPGFVIKVRWNNGDVIYYFHGKLLDDKLIDDGTSEMVFNGKKMNLANIEIK
ncbi:hypothetical protein [Mucilaginibacter boryungensis]|uniref:Uncharacterized protein n=1 Tax=Mucilaginibacter boryungensis TaxID=768480 RepID=A0ABR9XC11_9SPHI|nr:hypothetical protein [Mucilaginibacter boryungensis]MBE9664922.1 hypothetical protein [Mucilaginibacter boryungensis]